MLQLAGAVMDTEMVLAFPVNEPADADPLTVVMTLSV